MIAGHFGFAAAVKGKETAAPLWGLMLACQWLDVVFVPLTAAGIEKIVPVAGTTGGYGDVVIYADYTHSLVGATLLSIILGALFARYGRRTAIVIGLVSMSHWVLDILMHRQDMPILPGNAGNLPRLGFGLWRSHAASAVAELVLVVLGTLLYARAARNVAGSDPALVKRANLCTVLLGVTGVVVLGLSVAGL
ncbi:MAG TPA: hypothetical protein VGC41_10100 [Kofleriaceae bacterium]